MESIIGLLKDKNYHLEKFLQLNAVELQNFESGDFENLEVFYQSRETILDLIRCIDRLVETASQDLEGEPISEVFRAEVRKCMDDKNAVVTKILEQDLKILSLIEQAKSDIIRGLSQTQLSRKAVSAYKSGSPAAKLDEKA